MGRSLNALFRGVSQPRHPCIPAMDNLYCKDLAPRTDKRGRERMVQQCMAQVKTHPTYKGIYDVRNNDPSEERGGVKCYFFFKGPWRGSAQRFSRFFKKSGSLSRLNS
jgi:hypothetical protein